MSSWSSRSQVRAFTSAVDGQTLPAGKFKPVSLVFQRRRVWLQSLLAKCNVSRRLPRLIEISVSVSKHSIVRVMSLSLFHNSVD